MKKDNFLSLILFLLYLALCTSLIFSFRAITSFSIPLILAVGLKKNKSESGSLFNRQLKSPLVALCCFFFLVQLMSVLHTHDLHQAWRNLFLKLLLIVIPLAIFCCDYLDNVVCQSILKGYTWLILLACLIALSFAFGRFLHTGNTDVFVYHALVGIYSGHAIQFSILVFVGAVYLFDLLRRKEVFYSRTFHLAAIGLFACCLFLLSSKLVICFFLVYVFVGIFRLFSSRLFTRTIVLSFLAGFVLLAGVFLLAPNYVNNRFKEITQTDFKFLNQPKYTPAEYFNGLQFRMLQWRFVPQILTENKAWWTGVSVGDAQADLNQKYISANMYVGDPARGDKGFIGYNTHNEFLESLLQSGIPGLIAFILIIGELIRMMVKRKNATFSFVTSLLIIYSFTESVFESQYSLIIFLFVPLFHYANKKGASA